MKASVDSSMYNSSFMFTFTELSDFLILQKGVHECEKEVKELDQKFQEHDTDISKQEEDLRTRINDLDMTLQDLEHEEEQFRQSSSEEIEG